MSAPTAGEVAAQTPAAVWVFEKRQIHYCCAEGQRPLEEAGRPSWNRPGAGRIPAGMGPR